VSYTGTFHHTLDSKNRLIFPSRLRDELEDNKLTLMPYADGCIAVWSGDRWRQYEENLLSQRRNDKSKRSAIRQLFAKAHHDKVDSQGRIAVTQELREFAGITRDVVIVGSGDHAEIWSPERLAETQAEDEQVGLDAVFDSLDI
jgi:MraZ protein